MSGLKTLHEDSYYTSFQFQSCSISARVELEISKLYGQLKAALNDPKKSQEELMHLMREFFLPLLIFHEKKKFSELEWVEYIRYSQFIPRKMNSKWRMKMMSAWLVGFLVERNFFYSNRIFSRFSAATETEIKDLFKAMDKKSKQMPADFQDFYEIIKYDLLQREFNVIKSRSRSIIIVGFCDLISAIFNQICSDESPTDNHIMKFQKLIMEWPKLIMNWSYLNRIR